MRLLYVVTRGDSIGGAQVHVRDLAKWFSSDGNEVAVAVGSAGPLTESLRDSGIATEIIPELVREARLRSDLAAIGAIRRTIRKHKPDLVSTHSSKAGVLGRVAARLERVPVVFTAHGWAFTDGVPMARRLLYLLIEAAVAPLSPLIICVSDHDATLASRIPWMRSRARTIHNGVHDISPALRARPGSEPVHVTMVGRLDDQKDHRSFLEALARVPEVTAELIGGGPRSPEVSSLIESLGLANRVTLGGQRSDVAEGLSSAQIFALASNWEGLPRSIIEAMRAGLPVIASDVGGVSELVDHGRTGALVPRGDTDAFAHWLRRYASDASLRLAHGAAGRARYEARFTFEHLARHTDRAYRDVLASFKA